MEIHYTEVKMYIYEKPKLNKYLAVVNTLLEYYIPVT